jgi:hypothetical protein
VIGVASDARLSFSAGAFPPREGERRLNIEELGLSTAQAALGTRTVRPGNPVYIRVTDPDRSITPDIDELTVSLQTTSGDEIRKLTLKETSPFSGEFQGIVPTAGAQAIAFASESAPGRDPNMAISARDYPGWQGNVGDAAKPRTFGIDLNDNAPIDKMTIDTGDASSSLKNFVLQTSLDGKNWTTRARFPEDTPSGMANRNFLLPHLGTEFHLRFKTRRPRSPRRLGELMDYTSNRASLNFLSANVKSLSAEPMPMFSQSTRTSRRRPLPRPLPPTRRRHPPLPAHRFPRRRQHDLPPQRHPRRRGFNALLIERELPPGLHEIQIWRNDSAAISSTKTRPALRRTGKADLIPARMRCSIPPLSRMT